VEEGLLLQGIALQAIDISIGYAQGSFVIEPDFTRAGKPGGNRAPVPAGKATDSVSLQHPEQFTRASVTRKCIRKRHIPAYKYFIS
jgi:hypothetical protein